HPFVLREIDAAARNDLAAFDEALWGHLAFTFSNAARALWLGLTGGRGAGVPGGRETKRYLQVMSRFSAAFALVSDISMFVIGGSLKRREKISARLGDVLSMLYMTSAVVKRFHDEGRQQEDIPLMTWALYDSFFRLQVAMDGVLANFPNRFMAWMLRRLVFPKGLTLIAPSDRVGSQVAQILITPCAARDRLTAGAYVPRREDDVIGRLDIAMEAVVAAEPIEHKLRRAMRDGRLREGPAADVRDTALKLGVVTPEEHDLLARAERLRRDVVKVDDFDAAEIGRAAQEETWQQPDPRKKRAAASM
ncbi:MAG TPA: acyl-CoA dehydrogenase domain-containing protein, partial [Usitatibacter sp.]|nr:acyl-CoA dehydrogenase domain-containing protein [Usitatibacter sp.]